MGKAWKKVKGSKVAGTALADHMFIYSQDLRERMGRGGEATLNPAFSATLLSAMLSLLRVP